jgi:hypothetical protein
MKKLILTAFVLFTLTGCYKDDLLLPDIKQDLKPELQIANSVGIKLETVFVTKEVSMNVKLEKSGTVTLKIFDIGNRVVSKETINVKEGDNVLKIYTSALPSSAYRIGLFDNSGTMLGITDFNKIN